MFAYSMRRLVGEQALWYSWVRPSRGSLPHESRSTAGRLSTQGVSVMSRLRRAVLAAAVVSAFCRFISPAGAQNAPVAVAIDVTRNRHAINPNIYGVSFGTPTKLTDLNAPLTRWSGTPTSRYNWNVNADKRAADWYFDTIAY